MSGADWSLTGSIPIAPDDAGERHAHYVITCPSGQTPIVSLSGTRLSRVEVEKLSESIANVWHVLAIPCACGRLYYEHDNDSPHGAGASVEDEDDRRSKDCRAFRAAAPIMETRS